MTDKQLSQEERIGSWEEALTNDYYDYRWHKTLEPLCGWLQKWSAGELSHAEMEDVLENTHREICEVRSLFGQRQDRLVLLLQWLDRDWFNEWVAVHTPPPGARIASEKDAV